MPKIIVITNQTLIVQIIVENVGYSHMFFLQHSVYVTVSELASKDLIVPVGRCGSGTTSVCS